MGVPTDENTDFEMFGPTNGSDTTTIGNPIRSLSNTKGVYTFTAGQTFSKTFSFTNMLVADGDTFQLDITEG